MTPIITRPPTAAPARSQLQRSLKGIRRHWQLYLVILLPLVYLVLFKYVPLWGAQIAFKDYTFVGGVSGSPWVGFKHFTRFIESPQFSRLILNTLGLSLYNTFVGAIPPIVLAIALNYARWKYYGKTVQMVTYLPYFISTVLVVGILTQIVSLNGPVNAVIKSLGGEAYHFMGSPKAFKTIYVVTDIWKSAGYNAVVYLAALSAVSPELHEAAIVDGASIWQRIRHIDIPHVLPTMIILLILACGKIMNMGADKVLLMQNQMNMQSSDIIATYVYRLGIEGMQYSFSTAIGLFQSIISFIMLFLVNSISRRVSDSSLW